MAGFSSPDLDARWRHEPGAASDGSLVFASPVPKIGGINPGQPPSALYVQPAGSPPRRLTFSSRGITDPTMLGDGRILFVSTPSPESVKLHLRPGPVYDQQRRHGNHRLRQPGIPAPSSSAPVAHRWPHRLSGFKVRSRLPGGVRNWYAWPGHFRAARRCFRGSPAGSARCNLPATAICWCALKMHRMPGLHCALFRVGPTATTWTRRFWRIRRGMIARRSNWLRTQVPWAGFRAWIPPKSTGKILCLNANLLRAATTGRSNARGRPRPGARGRLSPGKFSSLGEVPVQADGSFLAEVPADVPLGFETLDENGRVLRYGKRRCSGCVPAENRSCIGCHEPRNRSPHNHRPLAVSVPMHRPGTEKCRDGPNQIRLMKKRLIIFCCWWRASPVWRSGSDRLLDRPHARMSGQKTSTSVTCYNCHLVSTARLRWAQPRPHHDAPAGLVVSPDGRKFTSPWTTATKWPRRTRLHGRSSAGSRCRAGRLDWPWTRPGKISSSPAGPATGWRSGHANASRKPGLNPVGMAPVAVAFCRTCGGRPPRGGQFHVRRHFGALRFAVAGIGPALGGSRAVCRGGHAGRNPRLRGQSHGPAGLGQNHSRVGNHRD
jgi:hypothetical protein